MKTIGALAAVVAALSLAGTASAETWKATGTFPASITTPRQVCQYARAEALSRSALGGVRLVKFRCQHYPKVGRWTPLDIYVRMSGRVVDSHGNAYTSRYVEYRIDFRRHVVRMWGSDEV